MSESTPCLIHCSPFSGNVPGAKKTGAENGRCCEASVLPWQHWLLIWLRLVWLHLHSCQHYQNQPGFPLLKGRWCWVKALILQRISDNGDASVLDKCPRTSRKTSNKQTNSPFWINHLYTIGLLFFSYLCNDQTYRATAIFKLNTIY